MRDPDRGPATGRSTAGRDDVPARQRILDAAILRFSRAPYAEIGLREIAADAQVDVAYVHRAFGSKAALFRHALLELVRFDRLFARPAGKAALIERLCEQSLPRKPRHRGDARPIDMILQSCASAEPREILREVLSARLVDPVTKCLGHGDPLPATLAASLLFGVVLSRTVLEIEPIAGADDDTLRAAVQGIVQAILGPERG